MVARLLLLLIRVYQVTLSPLMGNCCRFYPSCSRYTAEAIRVHGAARGSWLGAGRILRCNPFFAGGFDPVPPAPLAPARSRADAGASGPRAMGMKSDSEPTCGCATHARRL